MSGRVRNWMRERGRGFPRRRAAGLCNFNKVLRFYWKKGRVGWRTVTTKSGASGYMANRKKSSVDTPNSHNFFAPPKSALSKMMRFADFSALIGWCRSSCSDISVSLFLQRHLGKF
ncbi:unnamed protein product [Amoebophrya sp. A120]|nr:unnamed protein product [Amoebophrya sp. A120]|eukprot:GSA120T00007213001.1